MALADLTNPVLRGLRTSGLTIEEAVPALDLAEYWNTLADPASHDPEWSTRDIVKARKILLRRQRSNEGTES